MENFCEFKESNIDKWRHYVLIDYDQRPPNAETELKDASTKY